jgi:hypothetical protein
MKTAIDILKEKIESGIMCDHIYGVQYFDKETLLEFLEQVKPIEVECIKKAYSDGFADAYGFPEKRTADDYYEQVFSKSPSR